MSVQNESLDMKPVERKPEAPELEYKAASQDSLSMFFAAIGGAVLGMLATLLVLAIINGGTLNFIHPERLAVLESNMARINENVGAVSQNVNTVSQQVSDVRSGLASAKGDLDQTRSDLEGYASNVASLATTVGAVQLSGQRFETFVTALDQALASVDQVGAANGVKGGAGAPVVVNSEAVKPNEVAVIFFADANSNGRLDDTEANLVGVQVTVNDTDGKPVGTYVATDGGVLVTGLTPGQYTFVVADKAGHTLSTADEVTVTVPESGAEGQIVYFPAVD